MTVLTIEDLRVRYGRGRRSKEVVKGVNLAVEDGETVGLVGESGSGKSTIGRAILGLVDISGGRVVAADHDVHGKMSTRDRRALARDVQVIFQDPYSSLNPNLTIFETLSEALVAQGTSRSAARKQLGALLERVRLPQDALSRYPREFSGGQRQRIAIARALVLKPRLIVCDEPVSALDLTTQAVLLDLLVEIQEQTGVGYLFISHDLAVIRHVSHRVAVMHRGVLVEQGDTRRVTDHPEHSYTQRLLLSSPLPDPVAQAQRREEWAQIRATSETGTLLQVG